MLLTYSERGAIKDYVVRTVSTEWARRYPEYNSTSARRLTGPGASGVPSRPLLPPASLHYKIVNNFVRAWADGCSPDIQRAAERVFLESAKPESDDEQILKLIYDMTQIELKARGIKYIKLYRGQLDKLNSFRPLSSASTSLEVAKRFRFSSDCFYGGVYQGSIPTRYIASTFYTGYGCATEQEYVVVSTRRLRSHWKTIMIGT